MNSELFRWRDLFSLVSSKISFNHMRERQDVIPLKVDISENWKKEKTVPQNGTNSHREIHRPGAWNKISLH